MRLLDKMRFALRAITGREKHETEIRDEVQHFLALDAQQKTAAGLAPEEAQRRARVELGGVEQAKENVRALRPGLWLETFPQDARFAARMLRKHPGYLAAAVLTMALGIGANTAIFSVVDAALLRPLPYPEADRLMLVQTDRAGEARVPQMAFLDYTDMLAQHAGLENAAAFMASGVVVGGDAQPMRREGMHVTPSFFATLGVQPALGRAFLPEEAAAGKDHVAILSHRLWTESYGGRADALGQSILLGGAPHVIVGVLPANFDLFLPMTETWVIQDTDVFVPVGPAFPLAQRRSIFTFEVLARRKPGVSLVQAQNELAQIARGLAEKYRDTNHGRGLVFTPLLDQIVGGTRPALLLLMAAVGAVLLAACVNLANLMIGRLAAREQELAVRTALGASRGRLARQLLAESLLLVTLGGAAGVLVAWRLLPQISAMVDGRMFGAASIALNPQALAFALLLSLAAGVVSGLLPARALWHSQREESLHGAGRSSAGTRRTRLRKGLVVTEIALSSLLLVGAGLLGTSLLALLRVSPGFDPAQMVTLQLSLSPTRYQTRADVARALTAITERLRQLPGVTGATVTGSLPFSGHSSGTAVWVEGRTLPVGQQLPTARWQYVQQGYFDTMRIPLLRGRQFEERDIERTPHVTLISEAEARREFPGEDPIGKRVSYGPPGPQPDWHEIIGVVGDIRHASLREAPEPRAYDLFGQHAGLSAFVVLRTARDPEQVMPGVRLAVREVDPGAPVYSVRTMEAWMARSVKREQMLASLVGIFALAALFLGAVGAYGVIASLVEQRTREIGIRMALGAAPQQILRATVSEGLQLAVLGLLIGVGASLALGPLLRGMLFGVGPTDPRTIAGVAAVLLSVALAACYLPARRAARVDPIVALRQE